MSDNRQILTLFYSPFFSGFPQAPHYADGHDFSTPRIVETPVPAIDTTRISCYFYEKL